MSATWTYDPNETALRRRTSAVQRTCAAISRNADRLVTLLCAAIMLFLCFSVAVGVLYRYVLEQPLGWPEEIARFLLVWLSLLAAARSLRRGQHIALEFGIARVPAAWRLLLRQLVTAVIVVFVAIFILQSIEYLQIVSPQRATATGISLRWPYLGLAVSFGAMLLFAVLELIEYGCSIITGKSMSVAVAAAEERLALLNPDLDETSLQMDVTPPVKEN